MTQPTDDQPQPTLADVLAAVQQLATKVDRIDATTGATQADLGQFRTEMSVKLDLVSADIAQLRADVLHAKAEAAFGEARARNVQTALERHQTDPYAHGRDAA